MTVVTLTPKLRDAEPLASPEEVARRAAQARASVAVAAGRSSWTGGRSEPLERFAAERAAAADAPPHEGSDGLVTRFERPGRRHERLAERPQLVVLNKIDLLDEEARASALAALTRALEDSERVVRDDDGRPKIGRAHV